MTKRKWNINNTFINPLPSFLSITLFSFFFCPFFPSLPLFTETHSLLWCFSFFFCNSSFLLPSYFLLCYSPSCKSSERNVIKNYFIVVAVANIMLHYCLKKKSFLLFSTKDISLGYNFSFWIFIFLLSKIRRIKIFNAKWRELLSFCLSSFQFFAALYCIKDCKQSSQDIYLLFVFIWE